MRESACGGILKEGDETGATEYIVSCIGKGSRRWRGIGRNKDVRGKWGVGGGEVGELQHLAE